MDNLIDQGDHVQKSVLVLLDILRSKHPPAQPVLPSTLIEGNADPPEVHPVVFDQITAACIRRAALRTKGAVGPFGMDAHCWRRLCTSFKTASHDLCGYATPWPSWPDGCVLPSLILKARRIIAKAVLSVIKGDLQDAAVLLQLCAGQIGGIEAAVHFMRSILSESDTEAVLLVDASNAFNSLNRQVPLRNARHLCPPPSDTTRSGTQWGAGCPKSAMMFASSQPCSHFRALMR